MGLFDFFRKKKRDAGSEHAPAKSGAAQGTRHCFVLCRAAEPGDLSRASEIVAEVFGRDHAADVTEGSGIISVTRRGATVGFLAHMPAPIPTGEAEENADRNLLWPNGREEAAKHRSHVIATTAGAGDQTPIHSALAVTRLALVALKLYDGIGVYWGNASVSNSREAFEAFCEDISEEHVPVPVWLRFQLANAAGDKIGMYTLGMEQFDLMEIEVDQSPKEPQDLFEFVSNVAHYLIQRGPVVADGNTIGESEAERIVVRHRPSMLDKRRRVYKIVFDA